MKDFEALSVLIAIGIIIGIIITLWFIFTVGLNCSHLKENIQKTVRNLDDLQSQVHDLNVKFDSIKSSIEKIKDIEVKRNKREKSSIPEEQKEQQ